MLGLDDRTSIQEPAAENTEGRSAADKKVDKKEEKKGCIRLPVVRGPKATADTLFLDALYRNSAGKIGITYVDVWDGFVDEAGRFQQKGPDFEGQIRQLRFSDGGILQKPVPASSHTTLPRPLRCRSNRQHPTSSRFQANLLGDPGSAPPAVDALAARALIKGETLAPPAGRADDFAWPRREIAREPAEGTNAVAAELSIACAMATPC